MMRSNVRGLYTAVEAARLLGVGRSTMYELIRRGEVTSLRLGRRVLITRSTLEALLGFTPPAPADVDLEPTIADASLGESARQATAERSRLR